MSVTVRYKPCFEGDPHPHEVTREGRQPVRWRHFRAARRHAKHLNGGKLPGLRTWRYAHMFPDRVHVWVGRGIGRWFISRGHQPLGDPDGYPTHAAAMTAATQLAKETA